MDDGRASPIALGVEVAGELRTRKGEDSVTRHATTRVVKTDTPCVTSEHEKKRLTHLDSRGAQLARARAGVATAPRTVRWLGRRRVLVEEARTRRAGHRDSQGKQKTNKIPKFWDGFASFW